MNEKNPRSRVRPDAGSGPHRAPLLEEFGFDTIQAREACLVLAGIETGDPVLELGTGSGWMASVLAGAGHRVISVDVEALALEGARELLRSRAGSLVRPVTFLRADACVLPIRDAAVAHVVSFDAMHHMPDCDAALDEMVRVCRPEGKVCVADLNVSGLGAVRAVAASEGRRHEENTCRVEQIGEGMRLRFDELAVHELEFVTLYVGRKANHEMDEAKEVLRARRRFALVGASLDRERYSFELLSVLREAGYTVDPVNPRYASIEGLECRSSIAELAKRPEVAICALAPHNSEAVVSQVAARGIPVLWLPPGCWSEAAVSEGRRLGLTVIHDVCPIALLVQMRGS